MRNKSPKKLKLFYSINEVAKMFDLNESTLRYWEKEFKELQPKRGEEELVNIKRKILNRFV